MNTEQIRELTGVEADRRMRERMMFPTAEQFEAWGMRPGAGVRSDLDRLRDTQRRLKDNDSIEEFVRTELGDEAKSITHASIAREAAKLVRLTRAYKTQARVKEMAESSERARANAWFRELSDMIDAQSILPRSIQKPDPAVLRMFEDEIEYASKGLKRGQLFTLGARPDPFSKVLPLPFWAWDITTPKGTERVTFNQLKKRAADPDGFTVHWDLEANALTQITGARSANVSELSDSQILMQGLDYSLGHAFQSIGRIKRRQYVNAVIRPPTGPTASRRAREGVYNFKVDGRHTRKHKKPKLVVLAIDNVVLQRIKDAKKPKQDQNS